MARGTRTSLAVIFCGGACLILLSGVLVAAALPGTGIGTWAAGSSPSGWAASWQS